VTEPYGSSPRAERDASRIEAAAAGAHHETAEAAARLEPGEHVTATDLLPPHPHHHHPEDPNLGVVRGRLGRGAVIAAVLAAAVTVVGVVLLALAIGGG
jgi:hypothetical protein